MKIEKYVVSPSEILKNASSFYAHVKSEKKETLCKHTNFCLKYLSLIIKQKNLDEIIDKYMLIFGEDLSNEGKDYFLKMLISIVSLHDMGKINPRYQKEKCQSDIYSNVACLENYGSKHSLLSAYIYIEYFLKNAKKLNKNDSKIIKRFVYINAFIISRHHTNVGDLDKDFIAKFDNENEIHQDQMKWLNSESFKSLFTGEFNLVLLKKKGKSDFNEFINNCDSIALYSYVRLWYSILVACDYYATSEFFYEGETKTIVADVNFKYIESVYESSELLHKIRSGIIDEKDEINNLRTDIFLEAEDNLLHAIENNIFYLEAPTGSGKSNTAMNLSLKLVNNCKNTNKIIYVYPFNTLVEQNIEEMKKCFSDTPQIMDKIAVVNSITPYKIIEADNEPPRYEDELLDRQFLNSPIILTTHVSLFNTMFGDGRDECSGFFQLTNSVIVLDEIQSYKIELWAEIINFFKKYAHILNLKIIIMSATLPNLEILALDSNNASTLIKNRDKYFKNHIFKDRVNINRDLLGINGEAISDVLMEHVLESNKLGKKIMIEFIRKKSADEFYFKLKEKELACEVLYISGADSVIEREKIINKVKSSKHLILVATQVIEAGVDIDMDIGYKDIAKLDSEEQFMGRINRSCKKEGIVYFFNMDNEKYIYKKDKRIDPELSVINNEMATVLENKDFRIYYEKILTLLKNDSIEYNENNLSDFICEVGRLNFPAVSKKMKLIEDNYDNITVFLGVTVSDIEGKIYDGRKIWSEYVSLLKNYELEYPEKMHLLRNIKQSMSYFMYQVNRNCKFEFDKQIGDMFYIENGEAYLLDGKLNMKMFDNEKELFI